jgi:hypothetical protein
MVNMDPSVGYNSLMNGSIKVMRSLKIQKDNLECHKQGLKSLRSQPAVSNIPLSDSNKSKNLTLFHKNVGGLLNKSEELISLLSPDFLQVLCLTEHHLRHSQIDFIYMDQYKLGAKFCRKSLKNGGVSICVHST